MLNDLKISIDAYARANKVIFKHKLWPYLIIPIGMSLGIVILILILAKVFIVNNIPDLSNFAPEIDGFFAFVGKVIGWILGGLEWLIWPVILLIVFFTYRYVVLIALSPFLSHLSEVTEKKLKGVEMPKMNIGGMIKDVLRSLRINIRNLFYEIFLSIILGFIPIAGPVLVFIVQAYYAGFGLMDFTLERKKMTVAETTAFVKKKKGMATGLGLVFLGMNFIPIVGWMFAPTYGTVAATLASMDALEVNPKLEN